jgi:hypothetical protein
LNAFLISSIRATCPAHLILLYLITIVTYGSRSQKPSGLRQVLSWVARMLRSQVRILLGSWMCVCVSLCCVVLCR